MPTRWKQFERDVAALFGGARYWANSGEAIDVESDLVVAQCKEVKVMSLAVLTDLAEVAERQGVHRLKAGVVAVRGKRGRGRPKAPMLVVMTEATWRYLHGDPRERGLTTAVASASEAPLRRRAKEERQ